MAAAEYYNATAAAQSAAPPQYTPYAQSPYQHAQELQGSPVLRPHMTSSGQSQHSQQPHSPSQQKPQQHYQHTISPQQQQRPSQPPPYQSSQHFFPQDSKHSVQFTAAPPPPARPQPHTGSSSKPHSGRSSYSGQTRPMQSNYLQPPTQYPQYPQQTSQHLQPHRLGQPSQSRPYLNNNQSEYALAGGYASESEAHRRRRHRHRDHHDDQEASREIRTRKNRSRSTNTDGFLGAAGGGLIGDLIFPGLGTVGGAVAGWIGGKDYGKRRKSREDKLHEEQREWEHRFRDRSHGRDSRERRHSRDRHDDRKRHNSAH